MSQYDHECPTCKEDSYDISNGVCYSCGRCREDIDIGTIFSLLLIALAATVSLTMFFKS